MAKIKPILSAHEIELIKKIKNSRLLRNMTQAELSKKADITQSYLAYIEKFERNPSLNTIKKISIALEDPSILDFMNQPASLRERNKPIYKLPIADDLPYTKEHVEWLNTTHEKTMYLPENTYDFINKFKDELFYVYFIQDDSLEPEIKKGSSLIIQYIDYLDPYKEENFDKLLHNLNGSFVVLIQNGSADTFIRKAIISDFGSRAERKGRHPILFQAINPYYHSYEINQNDKQGFTEFKIDPESKKPFDMRRIDIKGFDTLDIIGVVLYVIEERKVGDVLI